MSDTSGSRTSQTAGPVLVAYVRPSRCKAAPDPRQLLSRDDGASGGPYRHPRDRFHFLSAVGGGAPLTFRAATGLWYYRGHFGPGHQDFLLRTPSGQSSGEGRQLDEEEE